MKLGFVGVGKHAQKMAAAFRECGAEVVGYDRQNSGPKVDPEWGRRMHWSVMLEPGAPIDALIICAPPEVTTEVALECAKAGKRCVATKPLMWTELPVDDAWLGASFETRASVHYVDLWRIYSPAWQALKAELKGKTIQSVHVDFYGNGPVRGFSGLLDWGVWPVAMVSDLLDGCPDLKWSAEKQGMWTAETIDGCPSGCVFIATGNGETHRKAQFEVVADGIDYVWREDGDMHVLERRSAILMECDRSLALKSFCSAFLAGAPSDTLRLSCEATGLLIDAEAQCLGNGPAVI